MKVALLALLAAGCLPPRTFPQPLGVVFEDSAGPVEYRGDVSRAARDVRGESCRSGFVLPTPWLSASVAWGDDSFQAALSQAASQANGAPLTDVRADVHTTGILIWREECLVVTAGVR